MPAEAITVVASGSQPQALQDEEMLRRLQALRHVGSCNRRLGNRRCCRRLVPPTCRSDPPPMLDPSRLLLQSLPIIPDSVNDTSSMWSSLQRMTLTAGSSNSGTAPSGCSDSTPDLDSALLQQLVADYQSYTRRECGAVVARQVWHA